MPDAIEYDPALIDLVTSALKDHGFDDEATAVLDALAAAGRLLPGEPDHWEWQSRHEFQPGEQRAPMEFVETERLARVRVRHWRSDRPDVTSTLRRRRVYIHHGEWEEVPDAS